MSATASMALPSLFWRRRHLKSLNGDDADMVELAHNPTWPAHLPPPHYAIPGQSQPNLYLQLSQILEWEIWTHNQTRGELANEKGRSSELEAQVQRMSNELEQWRKTYHDAYTALDERRADHGKPQQELGPAAAGAAYGAHPMMLQKLHQGKEVNVNSNERQTQVEATVHERKTPEPWNPYFPTFPIKPEGSPTHETPRPGSQTPQASKCERVIAWDYTRDLEMELNNTVQ